MRRLTLCAFLLSAACAQYPYNPPMVAPQNLSEGYRWATTTIPNDDDRLFVILTFSGGGTRAAGLGYEVLQQLGATKLADGTSLLNHVKVISSVSGGTFAAMDYGLRGEAILKPGPDNFESAFLTKPVQTDLIHAVFFNPYNWVRLISPNFNRIDLATEIYQQVLFGNNSFKDLLAAQRSDHRPFIIANATELELGAQFQWTQDQFDPICSDLTSIPVARAAAASSAFPIAFPPMVLKNYAHDTRCKSNYTKPSWTATARSDIYTNPQRPRQINELEGYLDPARLYLHLLDGGLADNIGLRGPYHALISGDTFVEPTGPAANQLTGFTLQPLIGFHKIERLLVIVVNAGVSGPVSIDAVSKDPSLVTVIGGIAGAPMDNFSFDSIQELTDLFSSRFGQPTKYYPVVISFPLLTDKDKPVRDIVNNIGTSFNALTPEQLKGLKDAADILIHQDPCFTQFVNDVNGVPPPPPQKRKCTFGQ
ncbi:MAG TPA: patatin-like phospholipase family protein [Thermoanaerobaculia bacterium]|jgi:NTE family protein|nr:patatin-like phospholipase family protein [Thermoanaerobaculia bacterium]